MGGPPGRKKSRRVDRGQTGFDFLVGMSVFLVTVGLVLSFTPGMFEPFDTETGPGMIVADRSASLLTEDLLVEDVTRPGVINTTCTTDFFDADPDDPNCRFDANGTELHEALHIDRYRGLNVTVESSGSITTVDGDRLAAGPAPPDTADVVVGKRSVLIEDEQGIIIVRVW